MNETAKRYQIDEQISSKLHRTVYAGHTDDETHYKVVLKVFDSPALIAELEPAQVEQVAEQMKALRHPQIVPIIDLKYKQEQIFVVSQYLPDGSLRTYLESIIPKHPTVQEALDIALPVGQALLFAHKQQIVHGNLTPEDIIFDENGHVLLSDFHPAGLVDASKLGYATDLQSACYMAPEQFEGEESIQSDQYALGCILYEVLSGHKPFEASDVSLVLALKVTPGMLTPLRHYLPDLPKEIEDAVLKALLYTPSERHASVT